MLERQAKCRPRACLSRLMSWRTLTSNTHTHALNGLTGLVAQANWGNLWPLCHFPPSRQCIVVARLFGICSVIRVLSAYAKGGMAILIANRIMHFFVPLYAPSIMRCVCCAHTHTHTHTRAINSTLIRANLIYCLQLAGQKDTALKAFQCNYNQKVLNC